MSASPDDVLAAHRPPSWFVEAGLGIFIHWGLYSVPAWAPTDIEPMDMEAMRRGANAYAEWYENSLRVEGSPTQQWHRENYGDAAYGDFRGAFEAGVAAWDPEAWADLFAASGARYVVLGTKHHDGFLMWPSATPNPFIDGWQVSRDVVGELADAVRARGMRFGLYYSGGLDWTFEPGPIISAPTMFACVPTSDEYATYVDAHYRELIERYRPDVLWNDIAMPTTVGLSQLLVDYLDAVPDGAINDRFRPVSGPGVDDFPAGYNRHFRSDFATPEYHAFSEPKKFKWEACRGVGRSFGYNRAETEEHYIAVDELIALYEGIVAAGGNLLLNVGPTGDGEIVEMQASRLRALGRRVGGDHR
jgi:alpha-L-fucosidase